MRARWLLAAAVAAAAGCAKGSIGAEVPPPVLPTIELSVDGQAVVAEVADTQALRSQGLMERPALGRDHGMVFVYPDEKPRSFWMKNTPLPLSIAFLDAGGRVVRLADMEPYDERSVPSVHPAMYALEMEQGWFVAHGVQVGERVTGLPGPSRE